MLVVLAGLVGLVDVVLLIWLVLPALYQHVSNEQARVGAEASTRTGLIAGLAGLAALIGVSYTARTYRLTEQANRVAEQGHRTDRYTKAIEQLGSAQLDVRLGGVYALERIAVDSERDHPTVVEVLGAFVRGHSASRYQYIQAGRPRSRAWPSPGRCRTITGNSFGSRSSSATTSDSQ